MNQPVPALPVNQPKAGVRVFWVGLLLQLSVFIGLAGTVVGMTEAFAALSREPGIGDPAKLSAAIGQVLESTFVGFAGNNLGVVVCLFALWRYHLRRKWMFWTSLVLGLLIAPLGLVLVIYCLVQRHEFFDRPPSRGGSRISLAA